MRIALNRAVIRKTGKKGIAASEYDIFLPVAYNNAKKIPRRVLNHLREELLREFGGLTDFKHRNRGLWKFRKYVFRDEIVVLRVIASDQKEARKFFSKAKVRMAKLLGQKALLITEREIRLV